MSSLRRKLRKDGRAVAARVHLNTEDFMITRKHALVAALCSSTAFVACADRDDHYDDTTGLYMDSAAGMTALTYEYTEAEMLGLIGLANSGTIELAKIAQMSATDPEVKTLAESAISGHQALDTKGKDLAAQLNVTPTVPSADESLAENQRKWMDALNTKTKGAEWDADYLGYEIERHETILDEVKDALSRDQRPELRAYLEEVRMHIEGHLPKYREVRDKLRQ
jgi:predicted outer membrane protein